MLELSRLLDVWLAKRILVKTAKNCKTLLETCHFNFRKGFCRNWNARTYVELVTDIRKSLNNWQSVVSGNVIKCIKVNSLRKL